jgi:hypothetical protein
MIVVKLMGGLGNQMFQYAAGLSLALNKKTELLLDESFLTADTNNLYTKRNLELQCLNLDLNIATEKDIKRFNVTRSNKYIRSLQRNFPVLFSNLFAAESGMAFQKEFFNFPKNTYLDGFWQSEKYFKNIESILMEKFTPKETLNFENREWLNKITICESVSLHIRRGDYVVNKSAQVHHGNLILSYYINALNIIKNKYSNIEVFVFSDDLDWCKENLTLEPKTHFVDANQKTNFHFDMHLMSLCKHNIIANSSFSWWGAWLNNNSEKIVVAPKDWFTNGSINTQDLIPVKWIRV